MHRPAHHEQALASFFRNHGLIAPAHACDGLIERFGLVLAMGFAMAEAGSIRITTRESGVRINGLFLSHSQYKAAYPEALKLADLVQRTRALGALADDVQLSMVITARRLEAADIAVDEHAFVAEGYPAAEILEEGLAAVQLAEAIKLAIARWRASARALQSAEAA